MMAGEMMADAPESETVTEMLTKSYNPFHDYTDEALVDMMGSYFNLRADDRLAYRNELKHRLLGRDNPAHSQLFDYVTGEKPRPEKWTAPHWTISERLDRYAERLVQSLEDYINGQAR